MIGGVDSLVQVRSLESTLSPKVADVHLEAFAGFIGARIGRRYATGFVDWFRLSPTGVALVAVSDDDFVHGYLVGARSDYARAMLRDLLPLAALGIGLRPWLLRDPRIVRGVMVRLRALIRADERPRGPRAPSTVMDLVAIGVAPESQGRCIGAQLMADFERRACDMGMTSVQLSVRVDNAQARRLYERQGWGPVPGSLDPTGTSLVYAKSLA